MGDDLDGLIEGIIVDAYGEDEQLSSFRQAFEEDGRFPFPATVVGAALDVTAVDYEGDKRRGLVALCRREGTVHRIPLLDVVPAGPLSLSPARLLASYRRWWGADPLPTTASHPSRPAWVYTPLAPPGDVDPPLALVAHGEWDPKDEYWGEDGDVLHPLWETIIAAGPRPLYEMEQVIPGVAPDDWDTDPIADAAELHRAGYDREAEWLLRGLLQQDRRSVDAWAHLGNIALDTKGPKAALGYYENGVGIAERSLPDRFGGVLERGLIDNRPFLRCLYGLGLCAWRQRRWSDADAIFTSLVWLDPTGSLHALACYEQVLGRRRWQRED
ncbi:MAG: hypothetical protein QOI86_4912 [Actinomycetota bacterium]|nr:hypothetical protein [Actinomycetota bacterium]